jgi:hypothetical protein
MTTFILPRGYAINGLKTQISEIVECAKKQHPDWGNDYIGDVYFFNIDEKFVMDHSECFKDEIKEIGMNGLFYKYNGKIVFEIYGPGWVLNAIEEISKGKRIDRW